MSPLTTSRSIVTNLFRMGCRGLGAKLTLAALAVSMAVAMPARAVDLDGETLTFNAAINSPGLTQEFLGGHGNPGNRGGFLADFDNFADDVLTGKGQDSTWWTGDKAPFPGPGGVPLVKYHDFTGQAATGNLDNYKVRATGDILIPLDAPDLIHFKDGVDDYTYLEINGQVLIDDGAWTGTDGSGNGGSPIADFDVVGLKGQWLDIEFGMAEGGGGDNGVLYWDALTDVGFPAANGTAIDLATDAQDLLVPDTHLRSVSTAGVTIDQSGTTYSVNADTDLEMFASEVTIGTILFNGGIVNISGVSGRLTIGTPAITADGVTTGILTDSDTLLTGNSGLSGDLNLGVTGVPRRCKSFWSWELWRIDGDENGLLGVNIDLTKRCFPGKEAEP